MNPAPDQRAASPISRRSFARKAAGALMAASVPTWFESEAKAQSTTAAAASANGRPRIALIGCGGQGRYDATLAQKFADVVAVCDVDESHVRKAAEQFKPEKTLSDFRKVLEMKGIDAIINGTPDHWHTLVNIAAVKAGVDVYSEKPLTLTIDEGKRLVAAVRKSGRILQTGSQQRSDPRFRLACELVRNGRLGKLSEVVTYLPAGPRRGPFSAAPVPEGLDWNTWQGQVKAVDYVPEKCHGSFRYFYEYSGGTMTDWGAHHNDIALWGMGVENGGPVSIEGKPTIEMIPGGFTAASEYLVQYTYSNGVKHICKSVTSNGPDGSKKSEPEPGEFGHGVKFTGEKGWIFVTRGRILASEPELLSTPLLSTDLHLYSSDNHMGNFFECIRSRKDPICTVEVGHRSASICHLGVIAIRLGRKLKWDPAAEYFPEDKEAQGHVAREMRKPFDYSMV